MNVIEAELEQKDSWEREGSDDDGDDTDASGSKCRTRKRAEERESRSRNRKTEEKQRGRSRSRKTEESRSRSRNRGKRKQRKNSAERESRSRSRKRAEAGAGRRKRSRSSRSKSGKRENVERARGTVKFFRSAQGFGFIIADDLTELFFHASQVEGQVDTIPSSSIVEYTPVPDRKKGGFKAKRVVLVETSEGPKKEDMKKTTKGNEGEKGKKGGEGKGEGKGKESKVEKVEVVELPPQPDELFRGQVIHYHGPDFTDGFRSVKWGQPGVAQRKVVVEGCTRVECFFGGNTSTVLVWLDQVSPAPLAAVMDMMQDAHSHKLAQDEVRNNRRQGGSVHGENQEEKAAAMMIDPHLKRMLSDAKSWRAHVAGKSGGAMGSTPSDSSGASRRPQETTGSCKKQQEAAGGGGAQGNKSSRSSEASRKQQEAAESSRQARAGAGSGEAQGSDTSRQELQEAAGNKASAPIPAGLVQIPNTCILVPVEAGASGKAQEPQENALAERSASGEAQENAQENAQVDVQENAQVDAQENAQVDAQENAQVDAQENAKRTRAAERSAVIKAAKADVGGPPAQPTEWQKPSHARLWNFSKLGFEHGCLRCRVFCAACV